MQRMNIESGNMSYPEYALIKRATDIECENVQLKEWLRKIATLPCFIDGNTSILSEKGCLSDEIKKILKGESMKDELIKIYQEKNRRLKEVLRHWQQWEANFVMDPAVWENGLPRMTQELYDIYIRIQGEREKALNGERKAKALKYKNERAEGIPCGNRRCHWGYDDAYDQNCGLSVNHDPYVSVCDCYFPGGSDQYKSRLTEAEGLLSQACQEIKLLNGRNRGEVQPILSNLDEYGDGFTRKVEAFLRKEEAQ